MPDPRVEKYPESKTSKEHYLETLDDLCKSVPTVAKRREMLLHIPLLMDRVEEGRIMDCIISGKGVKTAIIDIGSDSIALVYNNGWSLGFEGDGGEMVVLIDYINTIRPLKTGLEIDLETGEYLQFRFHGRTVEAQ